MTTIDTPRLPAIEAVTCDLYRDIHKGIRSNLFELTGFLGRLDPSDRAERAQAADNLRWTVGFLVDHAEHEDVPSSPHSRRTCRPWPTPWPPTTNGSRPGWRTWRRWPPRSSTPRRARSGHAVHRLYLDVAEFTSTYLAHQDFEERVVMPSLEVAIGVEAVVKINEAIIGSIPPQEMAEALGVMVPAMNVDDRAEMLGGIRAGAPAEVFAGIWGLAGSVLSPKDHDALASRLGLDGA